MSPEGVDGRFDSVGPRKLGHLLAGRLDAACAKAQLSEGLKYAVVAAAVTDGGLTIIANATNPAGISLLKKYFDNGVSPAGLLGAALIPTAIFFILFLVTR
jgi:hypothetical protein